MSLLHELPAYSQIMGALDQGPMLNSRKNIIAGPNPSSYWYHSRGLEVPEYREEGPFPIQGNIGALLKQEGNNNYASCTNNISIGGAPNCTGVFNPDIYTTSNTCGDNCLLGAPEAFGMMDFGMGSDKLTNIHGLHAYQNKRAGVEGRGPSQEYGCYEWVPNLTPTSGNSCQLNYFDFEQNTVGDWTRLPANKGITNYTYTE